MFKTNIEAGNAGFFVQPPGTSEASEGIDFENDMNPCGAYCACRNTILFSQIGRNESSSLSFGEARGEVS